jgi:predicted lipoprotein
LLSVGVLSGAVTTVVVACDSAEKKPEVDRQTMLGDTAEKVIVPTYADLATATAKLSVDAAALRDAPSDATLAMAQASWKAARLPWIESKAFLFGPAIDGGYRDALDFATAEADVEAEAASAAEPTDAYVASLGARRKGFQPLEILLFEATGNAAVLTKLTEGPNAAHRRAYLAALANDLSKQAAALYAAWDPTKGNFVAQLRDAGSGSTTYDAQKQAVDALLNAVVFAAEDISDNRLGGPLGVRDGGVVQPGLVVSARSGNDLAEIEAYWRGVSSVYGCSRGGATGVSLGDAVRRESERADGEARIAIEKAAASTAAVQGPLVAALTADVADVTAAREAARTVKNVLGSEIASILGLTIKFNTNDGD